MITISGIISSIEFKEIGSHKKAILTLNGIEKQVCFVEFRGVFTSILNGFKVKDCVEIEIYFEGKTSKTTGNKQNNLIAKSIRKFLK